MKRSLRFELAYGTIHTGLRAIRRQVDRLAFYKIHQLTIGRKEKMKTNQGEGKLLATTTAAKRLGVSVATLRNFIKEGRLTGFSTHRDGRTTWVTTASLNRLLETLEA